MDIRPNFSENSPSYIERPSSNFIDNSDEGTRYTQPCSMHDNLSETKALENRSVIETKIITDDELINLILEQKFSNNVHYQVKGELNISCSTDLTALPEHLSVKGNLRLSDCTDLTALPKHLSVRGDLRLSYCTDLTALPENLSVGGHLNLSDCTGLTALPENLSVTGDLGLRGCTGLTALPEHLSVGGYLDLEGCTGLTALPEHLSVRGNLRLSDCTSLTALPEHLSVKGDLDLRSCTGLTALPENLSVTGTLRLLCCTGLTALPEHLSVTGDLDLRYCTGLTALPKNLSVGGYLRLSGCTGLTALPEHFSVGGDLDLKGCTGLTALPEHLSVGRYLDLSGCTGLTALPKNLSVRGNLRLSDCTGLTSLPENLSVTGDLDLRDCTGLTALPENLSVTGDLDIEGCTGLTALPENLSVRGNLRLSDCTGLTALPENLSVGGDLNLSDCTGLTALPENLSVGGDLNLSDCTGLTALPENLSVGGDLNLSGCTGLTALPNWITTLGETTEGNAREVYLENTGLSDTLIDHLREVESPDMQFYFSRSAGQPEQQFSNVVEGLTFWRQLASADSEIPELSLMHNQATHLVRYLGRLTSTADYQNQATRPVLAQRVMAITALLTGSDRIRDEAMDHIHHALTSCDDRIILALDDLDTMQLLDSAKRKAFAGNADELRELGLQMMRLDEVKRIARDHMKTLSWVDEIEVELAFQIGVRQQLALPGSTQHMIFRRCGNVSDQDIANAVNQVNTHCSDDNLQAYLAQWDPWQKYLRRQEVPTFDQLPQKTVDRIEDCAISAEKTPKMVALGNDHLDYDALVRAVVEYGKNPLTNSPMDWSNVFRLTEEDSPPSLKRIKLMFWSSKTGH